MPPLSLAPLTINEAGPLDLIEAAAAGGFDAIALRVLGPPGVAPVPALAEDRALVSALRRRLAETGRRVVSATGIWLTPDFAPGAVVPALAVAAELGASWCLAAGYDADPHRLADNFAQLCVAAARSGLAIALEFMPYTEIRTVEAARRLIADAGAANAGIVIDALHLARSGGTPAAVAAIEPGRIAYLQLCDAPLVRPPDLALRAESLGHRLYPGAGELPLFALMDALPEGLLIDLEAPCAADAHRPFAERGRRAGAATRRFLASYRRHRAAAGGAP